MTRLAARLLAGVVGLALAGGLAGCGLTGGPELKTLSASFDRAIGVYVKSDVRLLGIRIGEVTKITPQGRTVKIDMTYDAKYKIPADAKALLVAPSIVSDRYVQLTPVYAGGPVLASGAELERERTAVPVELDAIYEAFNTLNIALGPEGANKDGALNDLLDVGAKNLAGNGQALNTTLKDLSQAVGTLDNQRDDLFGTVRNLQDFTTVLARNDATVRRFNSDLSQVAAQLEGEKEDLATAVKQLSIALAEVATFVRANSRDLTANVKDLASVTRVLVTQKKALEEFLDVSPAALSNLQLAYNPRSGTLDTRDNNAARTEANPICAVLTAAGQPESVCAQISRLLGGLPVPAGVPGVPSSSRAAPSGAPATGPSSSRPVAEPASDRPDLTLGGILEGGR
ncbi:MAG: hypothetical protein JWN57_1185 [Frankiales bacterium]|nr:hypothetical protein [Frankiales bacterium]